MKSQVDSQTEVEGNGTTLDRRELIKRAGIAGMGIAAASAVGGRLAPNAFAGAAQTKNVSVLNWHTSIAGGYGDGLKALAKGFQKKNPGAHVSFQTAPFATYVAAETTECKSHSLPDVSIQQPGFQHSAIFPCLKSFKKGYEGALYNQLSGWSSAQRRLNGTYFGTPVGAQGFALYVHKGNLQKAGVNPNKAPRTWSEFIAVCDALKKVGVDPIGISGADAYTLSWFWGGLMPQDMPNDADINQFIAGKIKMTDPRISKSLQYTTETYKRGYWAAGWQDKKFSDVEADFIAGKIGMVAGLLVDIVSWKVWDEKMGVDAYVAWPFPLTPGAKVNKQLSFLLPAVVVATNASGKNQVLAKQFVNYMASQAGQTTLLNIGGAFPNRGDVSFKGTHSKQAPLISAYLKSQGSQTIAQAYFKGPVVGVEFQKLPTAIQNGTTDQLLQEMQHLQETSS